MYRVHNSASRNAIQSARRQGLPVPQRPSDDSHLEDFPSDVTDIPDKELMGLYREYVAWCDYAGVQLALAVSDEKAQSDRISYMEAEHMVLASDKVTMVRAQMKVDADLQDAKKVLREREAYRRIVESLVTTYDRKTQLISREITRRTASRRDA